MIYTFRVECTLQSQCILKTKMNILVEKSRESYHMCDLSIAVIMSHWVLKNMSC